MFIWKDSPLFILTDYFFVKNIKDGSILFSRGIYKYNGICFILSVGVTTPSKILNIFQEIVFRSFGR